MTNPVPDPASQAISALSEASKLANTSVGRAFFDKVTGFKISKWEAQGQVIKQQILDQYSAAQQSGVAVVTQSNDLRKAANLIKVSGKAATYLPLTSKDTVPIDDDFFWNLVDHSMNVSDEIMQDLIAHLLAKEYDAPGSYSVSTLEVVKRLSRHDLERYTKLLSFCLNSKEIPTGIFNLSANNSMLGAFLYDDFLHLQSLGLISSTSSSSQWEASVVIEMTYLDKCFRFTSDNIKKRTFNSPNFYSLTPAGLQIAQFLNPKYDDRFVAWVKTNYSFPEFTFSQLIDKVD